MKNKIQEGNIMAWANGTGAAVSSGDVVYVGGRPYIACTDIANGATGSLDSQGVFELAKTAGAAWLQGQDVYWDESAESATTVAAGNPYLGEAFAAAASAAVLGNVRIGKAISKAAYLSVPLGALTLEDGTAITKFASADSATPGFNQVSNKEAVLRWNNHASPTAVAASVMLPSDLDGDYGITVTALVAMSGASDTPELVFEAFIGAGDTDCAGTDPEVDGGTALTAYSMSIAAADVPEGPAALTLIVGPKAGELGTDDLLLYGLQIAYQKAA